MQNYNLGDAKIYTFMSVSDAADSCLKQRGVWISCNAELLIKIAQGEFCPSPNEFYYLDGIGANFAMLLKYGLFTRKIPGCELWLNAISRPSGTIEKIALVGGTPSVNERAATILKKAGHDVCFRAHGYFSEEDASAVVDGLTSSGVTLLIVAMGQPRQEIFARLVSDRSMLILSVGGSLDLFVGDVNRAPRVLRRIGLEWFFRLINNPARFRRYLDLLKLPFIIGRL